MINVLTVCTGNICRSPYAERLLQAGFDELHPGLFTVRSAGTMAMLGKPMDQRAEARLIAAGGDSAGHEPRMLHNVMLTTTYDLVFAMSEEHRAEAVKESPRMLKRAYSIMMFAELFEALAADGSSRIARGRDPESVEARWKNVGILASRLRSRISMDSLDQFDVPDPYKLEDEAYDAMEAALKPAIYRILATEELLSSQ